MRGKPASHEDTRIVKRFLMTLWKLKLNPGPVPYDLYDMLEELMQEMSNSFFGDGT